MNVQLKNVFSQILGLIAFCLIMSSCKNGDDPVPTPTFSITIEEENTHPTISQEGGTITIPFTATGNWTASLMNDRADGWITLTPSSGDAGDVLLSITTTANDTYDERNATIVLKCGNDIENIVITQKQKDAILVSSSKYEVEADGGDISVEVQANISYDVEVKADWIKQVGTRSLTTSTLNFSIDPNETAERREGEIVISNGELSETIKVYQSYNDFITLTQKEFTLPEEGGTVDIEIRSTVNYEAKILDNVDWISEIQTRAVSTHTRHYGVAPNDSYDPREAKIVFYSLEDEYLADTVTIRQVQQNAIQVSQYEYTVNAEGGPFDFSVNTNVEFEVSVSVDWITYVSTRALTEKQLSFNIAENTSVESREGIITLSTSSGIEQHIRIIQKGIHQFGVKQNIYDVTSDGGIIQIEVICTGEYTMQKPNASWISEMSSSTPDVYRFEISPNMEYDKRSTEIVFIDTESGNTETVKITQDQRDAILVSQNEYSVEAERNIIEVEVNSNVDFSVIPSDSWIQQIKTKGLSQTILQFTILQNESRNSRKSSITLQGNAISQIITIEQKGTDNTDGDIEDMPTQPWE